MNVKKNEVCMITQPKEISGTIVESRSEVPTCAALSGCRASPGWYGQIFRTCEVSLCFDNSWQLLEIFVCAPGYGVDLQRLNKNLKM